jgi:hypothetical protein
MRPTIAHVVGVADVHCLRFHPAAVLRHQLGRAGVEHRLAAAADVDFGAQLQVAGRDFPPQARATAGDQDAFAFQQVALKHDAFLGCYLSLLLESVTRG